MIWNSYNRFRMELKMSGLSFGETRDFLLANTTNIILLMWLPTQQSFGYGNQNVFPKLNFLLGWC